MGGGKEQPGPRLSGEAPTDGRWGGQGSQNLRGCGAAHTQRFEKRDHLSLKEEEGRALVGSTEAERSPLSQSTGLLRHTAPGRCRKDHLRGQPTCFGPTKPPELAVKGTN